MDSFPGERMDDFKISSKYLGESGEVFSQGVSRGGILGVIRYLMVS